MAQRKVGKVTASSAVGGGIGVALASVLVWLLAQFGVDASPIETPLGVLMGAGLATIGGWLVKPAGKHEE